MNANYSPSLAAPTIQSTFRIFPVWKRALDVLLASTLAVCAMPLLAIVAAVIKLADDGSVLFWQRRVGLNGCSFWCPKLRSMHVGADALHDALLSDNDHANSITFKMTNDPRVTRIGRIIRRLSIDELPQLWCVLRGEMSLVGPRPALPSEVRKYSPYQLQRLEVRPGITGLWQVSGRSTIPFDGQLALDVEYITRQSFSLDLEILARTVPAVLSRKGAW